MAVGSAARMTTIRLTLGIAALVVGAIFVRYAFWFHHSFDAIIRIPFVLGSLVIGLLIAGAGLRLLLFKAR